MITYLISGILLFAIIYTLFNLLGQYFRKRKERNDKDLIDQE
jgi:hypothetical protein